MARKSWADSYKSAVRADVKNAMVRIAHAIEQEAKANAPVGTGHRGADGPLKEKIHYVEASEGNRISYRVETGVHYGKMVEFGYNQYGPFKNMKNKPFLYPAFEKVKADVDRYFAGFKKR